MKTVKELKKWYKEQNYVPEELEELVAIQEASDKLMEQGSASELASIIYDELMVNNQYPQFNVDKCCDSLLGANNTIELYYQGHKYKITVEQEG